MSQAVAHAQPLLYASTHPLPADFLTRLPVVTEKREEDAKEAPAASGVQEGQSGLRIAWQYQRYLDEQKALEERRTRQREATASATASTDEAMPSLHSSFSRPTVRSAFKASSRPEAPPPLDFCSSFDLRKQLGKEVLRLDTVHHHSIADLPALHAQCQDFVERLRPNRDVGRIVVHGLGQIPWEDPAEDWRYLALLRSLKGLVRTHPASVALVTLPTGSLPPGFLMRAQHVADTVLETQAVDEDDKELAAMFSYYGEIQGLLHVHKLALVNTQVPFIPEATSVAVSIVRRKRLTLEKMHIAPAFDDDVQEAGAGGSRAAVSAVACVGPKNAPSVLDF
ncbi:RNA polymerase II elongator complex subunit ELP4 [Klebsormidium nitens]|uniref:Elongator complex protein 4 n=1 Tax=Klebsormidium nitens TaxID=105231 RepID=A0A1Y1I600_KLENI|nr:RNA polymerase II elongator complex subunit ELP4 [Klebsormidium nitens]|eukprot:GAQ85923.1 RNA polymerase II elongator complex subunit ELP4 [Klebsormidium nitens]